MSETVRVKVVMDRVSRTRNPAPFFIDIDKGDDESMADQLAGKLFLLFKRMIMSREWVVEVVITDTAHGAGKVYIDGGRYGEGTFEVVTDE